jgi:hypothetical protein
MLELSALSLISFLIRQNLGDPEVCVALRLYCAMTTIVPVPEATMNEYDGVSPRQDDIR